ncbi:MAG: hypothetical protein ABI175_02620 [Polyangiales bacterium]
METTCEKCGATAKPGELICEFCEAPVRADAMQHAELCPGCHHPNVQGATACTRCKHVTQCLFCQSVAPLAAGSCPRCNEAFAGMAARKKARDDDAERQRLLAIGATVLGTAAPLLSSLLGSSGDAPAQSIGGQSAGHSLLDDLGLTGGGASSSRSGGGMHRGGGGSPDDK